MVKKNKVIIKVIFLMVLLLNSIFLVQNKQVYALEDTENYTEEYKRWLESI